MCTLPMAAHTSIAIFEPVEISNPICNDSGWNRIVRDNYTLLSRAFALSDEINDTLSMVSDGL